MEEKKAIFGDFFRSIFGFRYVSGSLFRKTSSRGFTLVELLIVIAIVGILSTGFLILVNPAEQLRRSRDSDRKADLKVIQSALELYRSDQGGYPDPASAASPDSVITCSPNLLVDSCTGSTTYLQTVPADPKYTTVNSGQYYYCWNTKCSVSAPVGGYALYACAESLTDTSAIDTTSLKKPPVAFSCPTNKFFLVTNP